MFSIIMVPVDLAHESTQATAVQVAADIGKLYKANVFLIGVTSSAPSSVAHNEQEFNENLAIYAESKSAEHDLQFDHMAVHKNDPAVELDDALTDACEEMNADLVVMASHVPGFMDHFFKSNASRLVTHTAISVIIVR